jgi:hypothetical protein
MVVAHGAARRPIQTASVGNEEVIAVEEGEGALPVALESYFQTSLFV